MSSSTPQEPRVLSTTELEAKEAKWVTLNVLDWQDEEGKHRKWEAASRKTRGSSGIDAVDIVTVLRSKTKEEPLSTIIIEQYRPPAQSYMIEFPAGLVDDGEDAETAAKRELLEETGFSNSKLSEISTLQWSDPGMTTANMKTVVLEVEVNSIHDVLPKQQLDAGEHIVRRVVAFDDLKSILDDYEKRGFGIDARLSHWALGWEFSRKVRSLAG